MDNYKKKFGELVKERRIYLQLSQVFVAGDTLSIRTLQRIENGTFFPNFDNIIYLCSILKIDLTDTIKKLIFSNINTQKIHEFGPTSIHEIQLSLEEINIIKNDLEKMYELSWKKRIPYTTNLEILYLAMFFEVELFFDEIEEVIDYLLHKNENYIEIEAEFLGGVIKKGNNDKAIQLIINNIENKFSEKGGSILPIIYPICIEYSKNFKWDKIIHLTTKVLLKDKYDLSDIKYLPHIYAHKGIAKLELGEKGANNELEIAFTLCKIMKLDSLKQFLQETIEKRHK